MTIATDALIQSMTKGVRRTRKKTTRRVAKATVRKRRGKKKTAVKKRSATGRGARARTRTTARKKKPARLVKGSRAAKRHMAKLRAMRRR